MLGGVQSRSGNSKGVVSFGLGWAVLSSVYAMCVYECDQFNVNNLKMNVKGSVHSAEPYDISLLIFYLFSIMQDATGCARTCKGGQHIQIFVVDRERVKNYNRQLEYPRNQGLTQSNRLH